ncbi:MAG: hypothetical protein ACM3JJ_12975 [Hyphomicrobiales bacterium]
MRRMNDRFRFASSRVGSRCLRTQAARAAWRAAAIAGVGGLFLFALAPAAPAQAQIAQTWLRDTPIDAYTGWSSARLEAMGGLRVAAEDPFEGLNAYDYSDNPAALLGARDTSWVQQGTEYVGSEDSYYGKAHSAMRRQSGFRGSVKGSERWALGLDVGYNSANASRHDMLDTPDLGRFIRDFDMPFATGFRPVLTDRTIGAKVEYPGVRLAYAREFKHRIALGLRFGFRKETESRAVADPYPLNGESRWTEYTGGMVIRVPGLGDAVKLAGYGQYVNNKVTEYSQTNLNDDRFDWFRPQVGLGAQLIVRKTWIRGIVDGRHRSFDGEQIARVNWAPEFFMNPFPSTTDPKFVFKKRWSSFLSGLRHNEASTRWIVDVPNRPVHVGWEWAYYREYEWIRPNPDVLQLALPLDVRRLGYQAGAGVSLDLPGREGTVATEMHVARDYRGDLTKALPDIATSDFSYHFGAEYRVRSWLPVRGGVVLLRHDPDRRDGLPPTKGIRLTGGAGTYWRALGAQVDVMYAHQHYHYAPLDPSTEIGSGDQFILTISRLF